MQKQAEREMNQIYLNDFKRLLELIYKDFLKRQRGKRSKNGHI